MSMLSKNLVMPVMQKKDSGRYEECAAQGLVEQVYRRLTREAEHSRRHNRTRRKEPVASASGS